MRIRTFGKYVEDENLKNHYLKDSAVVVDAQNFFYGLYGVSNLQNIFGCESDKYADYLRNYLSMFKKANVKCYFIFNGGHEDLKHSLRRRTASNVKVNALRGKDFDINSEKIVGEIKVIVRPIFMIDVCVQVLEEMGFHYTMCEFESKNECIALAQKLNCPVISQDIEFCFSGLPYIMKSTLRYDERNNSIKCGIFTLDDFLKTRRLTEENLVLFAVLTDENGFPENQFLDFIKSLKIPLGHYQRNKGILRWLTVNTRDKALKYFFEYINQEDKAKFLAIERNFKELIRKKEEPGIPAKYLIDESQTEFSEKDEFWFKKGVASMHIPKQLINLTRSGVLEGTWAIADYSDNDAMLLTIDIMKYVYNLLTNFERENFIFVIDKQEFPVPVTNSIRKPQYEGTSSPFESGWKHLRGELFDHFLTETLQGFSFKKLNQLPEDSRMLMTALIYFADKKAGNTRNEVCSIILSYIALGVVTQDDNNNDSTEKSLASGDENLITNNDKMIAKGIFAKYLVDVGRNEAKRIFDVKLLHPLVEFQHCLSELNHLNILCGKLYKPTIYSRTFNATFVYKILFIIKKDFDGNCTNFLKQELNSAPTVLSYAQKLLNVFDEIVGDK